MSKKKMKKKGREFLIRMFKLLVVVRNKSSFKSNFQFRADADEVGLDVDTDMEKPIGIEGGWKWKTKVGMLYEEHGKLRFEPFKESITGTKEWAKHNYNIYNGCSHDCLYCYAKAMAVRFHRISAEDWLSERVKPGAIDKKWTKKDGAIMYPTTHDIVPEHIKDSVTVLRNMLEAGNDVLIVSKPHLECIEVLCDKLKAYKKQILFRFTIGSVDNEGVLKFWDHQAPLFGERVNCLAYAYHAGFRTSVSIEPILDYQPEQIVKIVDEYVTDTIWLGLMNNAKARIKLNRVNGNEHAPPLEDILERYEYLKKVWNKERVKLLYDRLRGNPKVRWKDSIKEILGLDAPREAGLDV